MFTYLYFMFWIYLTVAEKEVYVSLRQKYESRTCHLPKEISFTLDEPLTRSHHRQLTRNDDINVNLPVYSLIDEDGVPRYKTEYYTHQKDSAIYQDIQNGASVLIRCVNGINRTDWYWVMDGHVYIDSTNHRLEPIFENDDVRRHNEYPEKQIYQISPIEEHHSCHMKSDETKPLLTEFYPRTSRRKRETHTPIKIDVAIFVDNKAYLSWLARQNNSDEKAMEEIKVYFTHVIAGVNLRFQSMPDLDVSILPISVTVLKTTSSWIDGIAVVKENGAKQVDAVKVLQELQNWLQNNNISAYDHLMVFTGYDLFSSGNEQFTTGLANIGEMCKTDGSSTSIVEDSGGFQSIVTASHELGHGINGVHDGEDNDCSATDRYIMSARSDHTETPSTILNPWKFSSCSISQFSAFFKSILSNDSMKQCLTEKITTVNIPDISNQIAGQVYGPDEQCRHIHGADSYTCRGSAFGTEDTVCREMFCAIKNADEETCLSITPAHGTSCGNNKWCIQGECVKNDVAPKREGNCIYVDQETEITKGKDCNYVKNKFNGQCYVKDFKDRCCETCERIKTGISGCEYGDIVSGCKETNCNKISTNPNNLYDIECCRTCNYTGEEKPTADTSPTTTTEATTVPSCTDTPIKDKQSCPEFISSKGDKQCYDSATETACCETCSMKRRNNNDCLYGDKSLSCDVSICGRSAANDESCCETCAKAPTTSVSDTTTTGNCIDGSGFGGESCPRFIQKNGKWRCYDDFIRSGCCETCRALFDKRIAGCPYGDKEEMCSTIDFISLSKCNDTMLNQCCQTCHNLVKPQAPADCQDGSGIGTLTCPKHVVKHGKRSCYESNVNKTCCSTCYSYSDLRTTDCMFGDRTPVCKYIKASDYTECSEFTKTHCCATCQVLEANQKLSAAYGIHLASFNQWAMLFLIVLLNYSV